jgi:hypothetical protein
LETHREDDLPVAPAAIIMTESAFARSPRGPAAAATFTRRPESATATTTAAAIPAPTTAGTIFAGTRFIDAQPTPLEFGIIQIIEGRLAFRLIGHDDESESAGFAGHFVHDDGHFRNGSMSRKGLAEVFLRGVVREIADVDVQSELLISKYFQTTQKPTNPPIILRSTTSYC